MHISMIKKIKKDGSPCRKCAEVEDRLVESGLIKRIDQVIIADERDPASEGMRMAEQYGIDRAPFFIVEEPGQAPRVYTIYLKFLKEVLGAEPTEHDQAREIMDNHQDLDYI
jgi:hypothetical protein